MGDLFQNIFLTFGYSDRAPLEDWASITIAKEVGTEIDIVSIPLINLLSLTD